MPEDWQEVPLASLCTMASGGTPSKSIPEYWGGAIPWISGASMHDQRISDSERKVTQAAIGNGTRLAPVGSTLVLVRGMALLEEMRIGHVVKEVAFNQDVKALIPDSSQVDPTFLTYSLLANRPRLLSQVHQAGHGTGVLGTDRLSSLTISLPSLEEQRRIAGVLGALDELIEVNRGLVRDLDASFIVSWQQVSAASSAFTPFGEVAQATKGLSYKGAFLVDEGLPMINMGSFGVDGTHRLAGLKWYVESEVKAKDRLIKGDLVVVNTDLTQSRDILARPIIVPFEHATSTHHTFQVRVPGGEAQRFWLYCALRQESVRQRLISYATGTTVAALPVDALTSQEIPWAEDDVIDQWWSAAGSLYAGQLALLDEIQQLSTTRDELLPLLVSGRVRVADGVAA